MRLNIGNIAPAALAASLFALPLAAHAATTVYNGNGATGFNGNLGNGQLSVSSNASNGTVTFALTPGADGKLDGNDAVIYIDSKSGGLANTSSLADNGDGGREAVSGYNASNPSRSLVTFAPNFGADYAISFEDSYTSLFDLNAGKGVNYLTYVTGNGNSGTPYTLTVTDADLGLNSGNSLNFVGTLNATSSFRSNEAIGDIGNVTNPGYYNGITFSNFETYTTASPAPEPSQVGMLALLSLGLGGLLIRKRRASVSVSQEASHVPAH